MGDVLKSAGAGNASEQPEKAVPVRSFLHLLLFPEVCLLAAVAGILAFRHPAQGAVLLVFVWLLDMPRGKTLSLRFRNSLLLVSVFACAFAYTSLREPVEPELPAWLAPGVLPALKENGENLPPQPVVFRARVESRTPVPGGRVRILLADIAPPDRNDGSGIAGQPETYTGKVVWTCYDSGDSRGALLPGSELRLRLRLSPVHGFANFGGWNTEEHWNSRNVWLRAWGNADQAAADPDEMPNGRGGPYRWARARQLLLEDFAGNLPQDGVFTDFAAARAILPALTFGDRSRLTPLQMDLFSRATLSHSLALSGMHMGFAVLAGFSLTCGIGRCFPRIWLRISRPRLAMLLALPLAGIYLWLGQMPVSLARAACMLAFWAILLFMNRPRVLLDGLMAAVAFILLLDPQALFDVSLQLSALSVASIALCLPYIQKAAYLVPLSKKPGTGGKAGALTRIGRGLVTLLGISLCVQVAVMPITVSTFGAAGLLFPLNLVWLPALTGVVMPFAFFGLAATALGLSGVAGILLYVASLPCEGLLALLQWMDSAGLLAAPLLPRPHWLTIAGFWLLCLVLPGFRNRRAQAPERRKKFFIARPAFAVCGIVMLLLPPALKFQADRQPGVRLRLLDVGQGQAVLVEWSGQGKERESGRALIDGGGFSSPAFDVGRHVLAPLLTDQAFPRLDMAINSHPDADHLGGLLYLLENFRIGRYVGNGSEPSPSLAEREQAALRSARFRKENAVAGDMLHLAPGLWLETLWPTDREQQLAARHTPGRESSNNASLILRLVWENQPLALVCGDAEAPALQALLADIAASGQRPETVLGAEILVLPHHGSSSSVVSGFYETVNPSLGLVSCGYRNRWGFPSRAARHGLEILGIPLLSTAPAGQILLDWPSPDAAPSLTTARPVPLPEPFFRETPKLSGPAAIPASNLSEP